ncbi:MAG: CHAP domain-containing protein [Solobacterium sp.]|nr:CHAP domain-containing protein [Solobacterium sp.]MCH4221977.1 CHAP domain-containing protein [Solobacterium sp.]MCH4265582.1 CHAP domain-containing protein [Solobacterium sp.]
MNKSRWIAGITALAITLAFPLNVKADDDTDYSNTTYWNTKCTGTVAAADKDSCNAYLEYMKSQNSNLQSQIDSINASKSTLTTNINELSTQISNYNQQISEYNGMIEDLNYQIQEAEANVEAKQAEIDATQAKIDELKDKVKSRLVAEQTTMRMSNIIDILMGAESFDDLIRIANGLSDISASDTNSLDELNTMQDQLQTEQDELVQTKTDLENGSAALESQQADLLAAKYKVDLLQNQYETQLAATGTQISDAQSQIASNNSTINDINNSTTEGSSSSSGSSGSGTSGSGSSGGSASTGDSSGNPYSGSWSNCTWGAWQLVHDNLGISLPGYWGNAISWLSSASAAGYSTGTEPRANSIAVWAQPYTSAYGHVAFVASVSGNSIYVKEGGYMGGYHERSVSTDIIAGYIYF